MKRILLLLFIFLACSLTGCGQKEEKLGANEYYIYYTKNDFSELIKEKHKAKTQKDHTEALVDELIAALKKPVGDSSLHAALGDDCKIVDYQIIEGKMSINFDVNYSSLIGVEEIMHRAAIVKTLTQVPAVEAIEFLVDDQPLLINKNAVGYMTSEDFIENIGGNGTSKTTSVSMYYSNADGSKLVEVPSKITYDSTIPLGQLMVEELMKGPEGVKNLSVKGLQKTIPENAVLNGMTIRDNVCYVDLSKEFTNVLPSISSEVTVYSVVNLLVELPNVNKVQFTIEGEQISKFGDMDFSQAFERNLDVVETQNTNVNTSVTIDADAELETEE